MFGKKNDKYGIYYHMYSSVRENNSEQVSFARTEDPIFEGTWEQCSKWLKVQYIDACVNLSDVKAKVLVDLDNDDLQLQIVIRKYYDNDKLSYYFSSTYQAKRL